MDHAKIKERPFLDGAWHTASCALPEMFELASIPFHLVGPLRRL